MSTTINAGASATISLSAEQIIIGRGPGAAVITSTQASFTQPLTAGDEWRIGPFDQARTVGITAGTAAITYDVSTFVDPARSAVVGDDGQVRDSKNGSRVSGVSSLNLSELMTGRSSIRRLGVWGDSTAAQNSINAGIQYLGAAYVAQALFMAGNPMDLVFVSGNSGLRTDQIIPNFATQVAAYTPDAVLLPVATNDLLQGLGADYALQGVATMARLVESVSAVPILMTINSGESFSSDTIRRGVWSDYNARLRVMAAGNSWPLFDAATAYLDPTSLTYAPLPGYTDGAVHPRNKGGTADADVLASLLRTLPKRQLAHAVDSVANVCSNVLLTGTTGTLQSGATGQAPTGCTLQSGGTGWTAQSSVKRRTDGGPGWWWEVASQQSSAAVGGFNFIFPNRTLAEVGLVVGDAMRFVVDVEIDAGHSAVYTLRAGLRFNGGSTQWVYSQSPESANGTMRPGSLKQQARVVEIAIPSGTTSLGLYVNLIGAAGVGSSVVRVGNPSCTKVA